MIAVGIQASDEIGRNSSTTGSRIRSNIPNRPMARPSGIAMQADISQAVNTRPRLMPARSKISPFATIPMNVSPVKTGEGRREG